MIKKILALFLLITILVAYPVSGESPPERPFALLEPGESYKLKNIKSHYFGVENGTALVERKGRTGVQFHYLDPRTTYWYINVDDKLFWTPEGADARVYVDYFDEGNASFTLRYCSVDQQWNDDTEVVFCENSGEWKTHMFTIKNATFDNRCNNADVVVAQWSNQLSRSTEDMIFGKVRIELIEEPLVISVNSDQTGNIFSPDEEMILRIQAENKTGDFYTADVNYEIYDHRDALLKKETQIMKIDNHGGVLEIKPGIDCFGTYRLKGELSYKGTDGTVYQADLETMFSLVDKFSPGEQKNSRLGVCSHWHMFVGNELREKHHETLSEMGANWDRSEIQWSLVEKEKGKFSFPAHASIPMTLKEHGIQTLQILDYGNELYSNGAPENSMPSSPEYIEAFKNYCVATVEHYKGTVEYFELWNEVNNANFNTEGAGIGDYAALVKAVVPAIKEVDPNIKIIAPVTINVTADWYREFFSYGTYDYIDCLSTHPYQWNRTLEKDALREEVNELHIVMKEYGEPKPVWISEMGWSTGTKAIWGVDPAERPRMALQMYAILIGEKLADKVFWYNYHNKGNNQYESTYNLGLIEHHTASITPFAAHDEYVMFAALNKMIGTADPVSYIRKDDETMIYRFHRQDGDDVILAWAEESAKTVGMKLGCKILEKYDMYGNKLGTLTAEDGIFPLSAELQPVYYKGRFSDFEEAETAMRFSDGGGMVGIGETVVFAVGDSKQRNLRIEVDTELEIVENKDGVLKLRVPQDRVGNYEYAVRVYADQALCYMGRNIVRTQALETTMKMEPVTESFFRAKLTVFNRTRETLLSGTAQLEVEGLGIVPESPVRFIEIKPGESMTFEIGLPEMPKARVRQVKTKINLDTGFSCENMGTFDFLTAKYVESRPIIDGKLGAGEWLSGWFAADRKNEMKQIVDWKGAKDSSFCGNLMWDEKNFYMVISATDNVFCQPFSEGDVWQGDGLQFGFSDNNLVKKETGHCTAMAAAKTAKGDQLFRSISEYDGERGLIQNAEIAFSRTSKGVIYEFAIPWSEIFYEGYCPKPGNPLNFSILMNDNDGSGRRGWLEFNGGIGTGRDYTKFGDIRFLK